MMVEIRWDAPIPTNGCQEKSSVNGTKAMNHRQPRTTSDWGQNHRHCISVELRHKNPLKKNPAKMKKLAEQKLSDDLAALSNRAKTENQG